MIHTLLANLTTNSARQYHPLIQRGGCLLSILLLITTQTYAQISIEGIVSNVHKSPVPNVNIQLYALDDSLLVKETSTDANGHFVLSPVSKGSYRLSASYIGYDKTQIFIDNALQDIHSLQIVLNEKIEELEEISVSAATIINTFDREIHFPTDFEKNNSIGGIELIDKMSLSGIIINKGDNSISGIKGGTVQLRINGAPATAIDVQAIDPKRVIRVEYHDIPSMRYGDAEAVIDFYVKNRESGGSFNLFSLNAFQTRVDNGEASIKINHRKSEFSLFGWYSLAHLKETYTNRKEVLHFEDGETLTRISEGIPARSYETVYNVGASYSYLDPDNVMFLAKIAYDYFASPISINKGRIYSSEQPDAYIHKQDSRGQSENPVANH